MRLSILLFFLFAGSFQLFAQISLEGNISDSKGNTIVGANIFIKDTYNGTSSDSKGHFQLKLKPSTDTLILVVSAIGFEKFQVIILDSTSTFNIVLKEKFNILKAVSVSAGSINARDSEDAIILKPLDILTTSGALGDISAALSTMPGTATIANDGRLFVRGGSARETATYFDGLQLSNAYGSSLGGIPSRSRFNPQLFKGSFFSTGAYSAEFGQALSSVLNLSTIDMPIRTQTDISLMSVGAGINHTQSFNKISISASLNYLNLKPYQAIIPQNIDWNSAPIAYNSEIQFRYQPNKRNILKFFYANQQNTLDINQAKAISTGIAKERVELNNSFNYLNSSIKSTLSNKILFEGGLSISHNLDNIKQDSLSLKRRNEQLHIKAKLTYFYNQRFKVIFGSDFFHSKYTESLENLDRDLARTRPAIYSEANYHISSDLLLRAGLRVENANEQNNISPRLSAGYRLNKQTEISIAYGKFTQNLGPTLELINNNLAESTAQHYLINYQWCKDERTLRVEAFHKTYSKLASFNSSGVQNSGYGFAQGMDLFYRDRKSVKNLDYWITYSFINSRRKYNQFYELITPSFAPKHNLSIVTKYWIQKLNSQLGFSFQTNDGYAYDNKNIEGLQESKTKFYSNLSLSWSYLAKPNLIFHAAITNVLGRKNVFSYQYSNEANTDGIYTELAQGESANRFFFIGVFYTLSKSKKANQLNNL